jgi:hypothetical protein
MGAAYQDQVVQVGGAAVQPVDQMMGVTPGQGPLAVGEHTAPVAHRQGDPLGAGHDPAGPPDLQRLAGGTPEGPGQAGCRGPQPARQPPGAAGVPGGWPRLPALVVGAVIIGGLAGDQHPGDRAVTGQPPAPLGRQRPEPAKLTGHRPRVAEQTVQVHHHRQLGPRPTGLGQLTGFQGPAGQLGQGVGGPLATAAGVVGAAGAGQRLQGHHEGLAGFGLQRPVDHDHALEGGIQAVDQPPQRQHLLGQGGVGQVVRVLGAQVVDRCRQPGQPVR